MNLHDKVCEILKSAATESEREALLKELYNTPTDELKDDDEQLADAVAAAIIRQLGLKAKDQEDDGPSLAEKIYPDMATTLTESEPFEGFSDDIKDFAKGFYTSMKQEVSK